MWVRPEQSLQRRQSPRSARMFSKVSLAGCWAKGDSNKDGFLVTEMDAGVEAWAPRFPGVAGRALSSERLTESASTPISL